MGLYLACRYERFAVGSLDYVRIERGPARSRFFRPDVVQHDLRKAFMPMF